MSGQTDGRTLLGVRPGAYELRERGESDGSEPSKLYLYQAGGSATLADVLRLAERCGETVDVHWAGVYLLSYCGGGPYWWPPSTAGDGMHQIGSHGWCHDCHKDGKGYVHHLDYGVELAMLTAEAREDRVLRRQCEADGLTPEQYAAGIAGRAVPLHGDSSFAVAVHTIGSRDEVWMADFAVDMWDMTTWRVSVPIVPGAPDAAVKLAEETAYAAQPKRCYDCKGTRGHAKDCSETRWANLIAKYGP